MKYDYLIVCAGLFGSTFAHLATKVGKRCLIVEHRNHTGGNLFCENISGICQQLTYGRRRANVSNH